MTDDILVRYLLAGGLDWATLLALFVVALVYFLAPALGYVPTQRGLLLGAMWVLLAKVGVTVLKTGYLLFAILEGKGAGGGPGVKAFDGPAFFVLMSLFEGGLLVLGLVLFIAGLAGLRRHDDVLRPSARRPFVEE
jgi:hypothetical protein